MTTYYVEQSTNTIKTIHTIRLENLTMSIPDGANLSEFGYEYYITSPKPDALLWHIVEEGVPVNNTQVWVQVPMTVDEIKEILETAVQKKLDDHAKSKGYSDIVSACSYAGAPNPFQTESQNFVSWRGNVWATCYQILNDVNNGLRQIPTESELLAELPQPGF